MDVALDVSAKKVHLKLHIFSDCEKVPYFLYKLSEEFPRPWFSSAFRKFVQRLQNLLLATNSSVCFNMVQS